MLAKPGTDVGRHFKDQEVSYADLPYRAVAEFTKAVCGLVPNTVLGAIASIRENTSRLIAHLSRELDAPYLTHRALLPNPDDSEQLLLSLIASECRAVLEDEDVGQFGGLGWLSTWIESRNLSFPLNVSYGNISVKLTDPGSLKRLLEVGAQAHLQESSLSPSKRAKAAKQLGELDLTGLLSDRNKDESPDALFALLTTQRPHYGANAPILTLGSILRDNVGGTTHYWVCIQPKCDAVRVEKRRRFLFLPLEPSPDNRFCTVTFDQGKVLKLRRTRKPYEITSFTFPASANQVVRASRVGDDFLFSTTSKKKLTWLGQLRDEIAQQIAHDVSTRLSRVGANPSEWLRYAERRLLQG